MTPELKSKWLSALRSGKYKQGKKTLNCGGKMCCLGVLCDVAGFDWHDIPGEEDHQMCDAGTDFIEEKKILNELGLSPEVHEACFSMNDGTFKLGAKQKFDLKELRSYSFLEIADWLETHL